MKFKNSLYFPEESAQCCMYHDFNPDSWEHTFFLAIGKSAPENFQITTFWLMFSLAPWSFTSCFINFYSVKDSRIHFCRPPKVCVCVYVWNTRFDSSALQTSASFLSQPSSRSPVQPDDRRCLNSAPSSLSVSQGNFRVHLIYFLTSEIRVVHYLLFRVWNWLSFAFCPVL